MPIENQPSQTALPAQSGHPMVGMGHTPVDIFPSENGQAQLIVRAIYMKKRSPARNPSAGGR